MDDVRVHRNSPEPAKLGALAYAQGSDIHLGPGHDQHLPHEAWHVVQQKQGRVPPTAQLKAGISVNGDQALEREADTMGARALSGRAASLLAARIGNDLGKPVSSPSQTIQRMTIRTVNAASQVSTTTHNKHVKATGAQAAAAQANYGSTTFVTADNLLTGPVDLNNHNFTQAARTRSGRFDFNANVVVYVYHKTGNPPAGWARGQPVAIAVNGQATNCEIGVVKDGTDRIKVTHFKAL
jgi:hypothetical protein